MSIALAMVCVVFSYYQWDSSSALIGQFQPAFRIIEEVPTKLVLCGLLQVRFDFKGSIKSTSVVQIWFPLIKGREFCFVDAISVQRTAFWMQLKIKNFKSCFHKIATVIRNRA